MINRICTLLFLAISACTSMAGQFEPTLVVVSLPKYPPLARQARVEAIVNLTFTLAPNATKPTNIEVTSGHPLLNSAVIENVTTWKFDNPYAVERRYEAKFTYRFSGPGVAGPATSTVTFDSFHQVDVITAPVASFVNY